MIAKFVRTDTVDWEGTDASAIFFSGCNLRCPGCERKDIVSFSGSPVDENEILDYLDGHRDFVKGVILTGGEASLSAPFSLLKNIRKLGMRIRLETNGFRPDILDDLIGANYVDSVLIDIKSSFDDSYNDAAGTAVDTELLRKSISIVSDYGTDCEFRIVCSPDHVPLEKIGPICKEIKGSRTLSIVVPKTGRQYKRSELMKAVETAKEFVRNVRLKA